MTTSLWRQHILPFTLLLGLLAAATLAGDYLLHRLNLVWVGRYLGIPGTLLIIGSLIYSLRKRKYITAGNPKTLLTLHEFGTWLGSLMVLLHAGMHFNAILPWLATVAMGVNVISGMVGKLLLARSRRHVQGAARALPAARPVASRGGTGRVLGCGDTRCHDQMAKGAYPDLHRFCGAVAGPHHQHLPVLGLGMNRILKIILAANLIVIAVLVFVYPHLMVGPGKLIPGHKQLEADCFACHAPLLGAPVRTLHYLPRTGRDRASDNRRPAHRKAAHLHAFPPEADQPGLRGLP